MVAWKSGQEIFYNLFGFKNKGLGIEQVNGLGSALEHCEAFLIVGQGEFFIILGNPAKSIDSTAAP
jgi:hypothetical protein